MSHFLQCSRPCNGPGASTPARTAVALWLAGLFVFVGTLVTAQGSDPVLYQVSGRHLTDGAGGKIILLQRALNRALDECGSSLRIEADGALGRRSVEAVAEVAACDPIVERLPAGSPAREGAVTDAFWRAVLADEPPPSPPQRARAILLAFEATDYSRAEWNFCQNRPLYDPPDNLRCVSNDPSSFLTWGPNGATAGHGQEVQAILAALDAEEPQLLDRSFGAEAPAVRRLLTIEKRDVERYLCSVWLDPSRRQAWRSGFASLAVSGPVAATYDQIYASVSFDGGKISAFQNAWAEAGLEPTEIDLAFFIDRSAHMSISESALVAALEEAAAAGPLEPWQARRAVSLAVVPGNVSVRRDRLGRDVTFYIDGGEAALTAEEREAWETRSSRRASDVGLSDDRPAPTFQPGPPVAWKPATFASLTEAERAACPAEVLEPERP